MENNNNNENTCSSSSGPKILRPVPRRPMKLNLLNPTPPDGDSAPSSPAPPLAEFTLPPHFLQPTPDNDSPTLSRPQSFMNLTSSTLSGIYSQATPSRDRIFGDGETPWGTGAQTPIKRPDLDDDTYELLRDRSHLIRRRSSIRVVEKPPQPSTIATAASLAGRTLLLFVLGVGYGVVVTTRFHLSENKLSLAEGIIRPTYNWVHLTCWGVAGVGLGALLPWLDYKWEDWTGNGSDEAVVDIDTKASADWALVIRAIGVFVGIVFAIRKVNWASSLQVCLTLGLANPLLWWVIDRSKSGLLLSAAVGLMGSGFLLGINPDAMPAPSSVPSHNSTANFGGMETDVMLLGGLATQQTVETGVWLLNVLFCSCVCFGNIGRRLSLNRGTTAKGRWAGLQ